MQIKTLLPSLLLLAPFVAADDAAAPAFPGRRTFMIASLGVSKRDVFSLNPQPVYAAMPLDSFGAGSLVKRQSCPPGSTNCYTGCCKTGFVCGIYGGEEGCCPIGRRCGSVSGCQTASEVFCGDYCCPSGSACARDATGEGTCRRDDTGSSDECSAGPDWEKCPSLDGCCPKGVACIPPNKCDVQCGSEDVRCGTGCCPQGTTCGADLKCTKEVGEDFTTLVRSTTTETVVTTTEVPEPETTTTEDESSTETTDDSFTVEPNTTTPPTESETSTESSTTETDTTTPTFTTPRLTIPTVNENYAPTMAAMLGGRGGLGMAAAGVLGVLAF